MLSIDNCLVDQLCAGLALAHVMVFAPRMRRSAAAGCAQRRRARVQSLTIAPAACCPEQAAMGTPAPG
jgi:hypothetical protein